MKFRTEITPDRLPAIDIRYGDGIFCIGSCFAENIGAKLRHTKFNVDINPFGIIYNPISISEGISRILSRKPFSKKDIFKYGDLWHSWMHHGSFSSSNEEESLHVMNQRLKQSAEVLENAGTLLLTPGTAHVYKNKDSGKIVANCHKVPSERFTKEKLTIKAVVDSLETAILQLLKINPRLQIVCSVSPVRYIRDGLSESLKSKSILLLALDELEQKFKQVHYFPAYEILMDDLRDYRFYARDLIHPSEQAINYIWNKFRMVAFSKETASQYHMILKQVTSFNHRILHPGTPSHLRFIQEQLDNARQLMKDYEVDFSKEIEMFEAQLKAMAK